MSAIIHLATRQVHLAGAILSTLAVIAGGTVFYDQAMPVAGNTVDRVITPMVEAGGLLTVGYKGTAKRQCPTDNIRISITDAQGVVYRIAVEKANISLLEKGEAGITVTVPQQAGLGTALFNISYDKICNVLALWSSVHRVELPAAAFIVKEPA